MVGVEYWLMARWKARVEYLLSVIVLLFLPLAVEELQGKMSKLAAFRRVGHLEPRFQGKGSPPANILIPLERQLIALQLCR